MRHGGNRLRDHAKSRENSEPMAYWSAGRTILALVLARSSFQNRTTIPVETRTAPG